MKSATPVTQYAYNLNIRRKSINLILTKKINGIKSSGILIITRLKAESRSVEYKRLITCKERNSI